MDRFKKYYDEKYLKIALYVINTALITFVLGMIIYNLSKGMGTAFTFVGSFMAPLIIGMALAYLFSPLVKFFEEKVFNKLKNEKNRRLWSVLLTFLLIIIFILIILATLVITITKSVTSIDFNNLLGFVENIETDLSSFWKVVEEKLADFNIDLGAFGPKISKIFNNVSSFASTLLFANIFAVYFLLDSQIGVYWKNVLEVLVSEKTRAKLLELSQDADRVFSGYIRGQSLDALMVGVMVTIALLIAGIPYAVVIGLLTGIGNMIPYVGPVVGFASLVIVCLSEGSITHLITGAVILLLVNTIDGNIINPRLLSNNVEIHPVLVIVALIAGGQVGGILGMLVAVPVAALLKLQFDKYVEKKKNGEVE